MLSSIRKLDPQVATQIAAGEVVERPASVVKELVENAIDANAKRITIDIVDGGLEYIRVSDDGIGMSKDDVISALDRFATSKIQSVSDLEKVRTLGFRGEALPSIAVCSKLTLETRANTSESGTAIYVEGGHVVSLVEKGLPQGTTVTVQDLFFNAPARLRFMKTKSRERDAIIEAVERLALAWPSISFTLTINGRIVFHTTGNGLRNAITDIFGPEMVESSIEVYRRYPGEIVVQGFAGKPSNYRSRRDRQIFSVNQRPIKNPILGWALDSAYAGLLPPKGYPVGIIDISIPPDQIDVNVHPTKAEIKFKNDREIRHMVTESVRESLIEAGYLLENAEPRSFHVTPSETYDIPVGYTSNLMETEEGGYPIEHDSSTYDQTLPDGWEYLGDLQNTYLVAKTEDSLLIVDQHALAESIAYQALLKGESGSQELLISEIIELGPKEASLYEEYGAVLEEIGFSTRLLGTRTVLVTKVPVILGKPLSPDSFKEILLSAYSNAEEGLDQARILAKAQLATAACHSSVRANEPLTREEAIALLKKLSLDPTLVTCPHGRPTTHKMPYAEIAKLFGR